MGNSSPVSALPAFDAVRFEQLRKCAGVALGHPLMVFESIGSTNDEAKRAARCGAPTGALYVAEHQTAGRGRHARRWFSAPRENLLFSVVLRPSFSPKDVRAYSLVVGLAVRAAVGRCGAGSALIKWPNDVLVGRRKLAGVLVESQLHGNRVSSIIVGAGINVNCASFEGELAGSAISLGEIVGAVVSREALLAEVLGALADLTGVYERGGLAAVLPELHRSDALRGQAVVVDGTHGVGAGIDADGALLLDTEAGQRALHSGSVSWAG